MASAVSMGSSSPVPFEKLIDGLSRPAAFPGSYDSVECIQTHISAVFLVGNLAYKVKKPKDLGFLNFASLEARRHFCQEEVRLNRRMAPEVYEGVVPIVRLDGELRVGVETIAPEEDRGGSVVDWAVRMVRLPQSRRLDTVLTEGGGGVDEVASVAARVADFHATAERSHEISETGGWKTVSANNAENFEQIVPFIGETLSASVFGRLESACERELEGLRSAIESRVAEGLPCDSHGDLRLEHVYLLPPGTPGGSPDRAPADGDEVVVIDCVEFNERYRWSDPVADAAFLFTELEFLGRRGLARTFARSYLEAARDPEGAEVLPFYATYRDIVRGKVRSLQAADPELSDDRRRAARRRARHHFLAGLARLVPLDDRPAVVCVFGLPGVGKSTVARGLAERAGFDWIDTDRVRKELAGEGGSEPMEAFEEGLYSAEWTERTYAECLERAERVAGEGGRVVIEGSFRRDRYRSALLRMASELGVPALLWHCRLDEGEAERRLDRRADGPSDADWEVHRRMARDWEPISDAVAPRVSSLGLEGTRDEVISRALKLLASEGLATIDG